MTHAVSHLRRGTRVLLRAYFLRCASEAACPSNPQRPAALWWSSRRMTKGGMAIHRRRKIIVDLRLSCRVNTCGTMQGGKPCASI